MKKFDFLYSTNFKLLRQIGGNSIFFFKVHNFSQGWPLPMPATHVNKNLAMPLIILPHYPSPIKIKLS